MLMMPTPSQAQLCARRILSVFSLIVLLFFSSSVLYAADANEKNEEKDKKSQSKDKSSEKSASTIAASQIEDSMANLELIQQTLKALRTEIKNSKEKTSLNRSSVKTISEGLTLIDEKLKQAYSGLDESQTGINSNTSTIDKLNTEILSKTREIRANAAGLYSQKSLIEDNSIRLYELLIQLNKADDNAVKLTKALDNIKQTDHTKAIKQDIGLDINRLWTLLAIVLVFFTPLAFVLSSNRNQYKPLIDGTEQHQGVILVCLGVFLGFFAIGFGLMYGNSTEGWIGTSNYLLPSTHSETTSAEGTTSTPRLLFTEFVLYQTGFIFLAAMIVYIAVGRQLSIVWHLLLAFFVGAVLIPIAGHWAWSNHFVADNNGWLQTIGFIDEAGALIINAVSAWFAFILVLRLGRLSPPPLEANQEFNDPIYSSSAVLLLWLSWFGFTTGTLPISNEEISSVMLNVSLAGAAGGLMAFLHHLFFSHNPHHIASGLGGFVAGLVAIAACAQSVTFIEAIIIGASAGILQNLAYSLLCKFFLRHIWQKRAANLVAIHGVGGIWGALCVALMGTEGTLGSINISQLIIQAQGIAIAIVYSIVAAHIVLFFLKFRRQPTQKQLT